MVRVRLQLLIDFEGADVESDHVEGLKTLGWIRNELTSTTRDLSSLFLVVNISVSDSRLNLTPKYT